MITPDFHANAHITHSNAHMTDANHATSIGPVCNHFPLNDQTITKIKKKKLNKLSTNSRQNASK